MATTSRTTTTAEPLPPAALPVETPAPTSPADRAAQAAADEASTLAQAEALGANLPAPGTTPGTHTGTQAAEAMGEETVKMNFPHAFSFNRDYGEPPIFFPAGINEVPASL